jgi:hypothetical protein
MLASVLTLMLSKTCLVYEAECSHWTFKPFWYYIASDALVAL